MKTITNMITTTNTNNNRRRTLVCSGIDIV